MELQDILTNDNKSNQSFKTQYFRGNIYQSHNLSHPLTGNFNLSNLINGIKNNKKIRNLVIIVAVIFLVIIIGMIALLLPLIFKIFNYLTSVGISGLIDAGLKFINELLSIIK